MIYMCVRAHTNKLAWFILAVIVATYSESLAMSFRSAFGDAIEV
jgi:hypothetical protein